MSEDKKEGIKEVRMTLESLSAKLDDYDAKIDKMKKKLTS
jgi:hypothetical protein